MSVMLVIIIVGVTIDRLIFAPLERRVRARWGLAA
jgi:NitT/TauT family transport system permease protein